MFKLVYTLSLSLFILSCSSKAFVERENQESAYIILKTPKLKYADMGFIYKGGSFVKVEIYSMGQPLLSLNINGENICMSTFECMDRGDFNRKMLVEFYPDDLLETIFRGEPIFGGEGLERGSNSFTQKVKKDGEYDISYSVDSSRRAFRDRINKIKIEVRVK